MFQVANKSNATGIEAAMPQFPTCKGYSIMVKPPFIPYKWLPDRFRVAGEDIQKFAPYN
jgi:hypothetical protein